VNETTPSHPQNSFEQGGRILVLEPEEDLASKILAALREAAPAAQVNLARSLEEAQRLVMNDRPDLFVLAWMPFPIWIRIFFTICAPAIPMRAPLS
jgi:hypothetical protein